MAIAIPNAEIFLIDYSQPKEDKKVNKVNKVINRVALGLIGGPLVSLSLALREDASILKRCIDEKRVNIISSEEELANYINANDNSWVINDKSLKKRQYYIRHPKKSKENVLIEANDFYRYIEEEQKEELVAFILAHAPAKEIKIDKTVSKGKGGSVSAKVKGADLHLEGNVKDVSGNYFSLVASRFGRLQKVPVREEYYWIDKSLMTSIKGMQKGVFTQTYEIDFECGLSGSEAKTIGLDVNMHKKFSYTIYIKC